MNSRHKHVTRGQYQKASLKFGADWQSHPTEASTFCVMQWLDKHGVVQAQATYHNDGTRVYSLDAALAERLSQ